MIPISDPASAQAILDFLLAECRRSRLEDHGDTSPVTVEEYLAFGNKYLARNHPTRVQYLDRGLGIMLTDGTLLAFSSEQTPGRAMHDECVRVIGSPVTGGSRGLPVSEERRVF